MLKLHYSKVKASMPQKIVDWLFHERALSLGFLEWMKLLSITLFVRNRQTSQDFFDALSSKISTSFANPDLSTLKKDLILYTALSYIAFADPQEEQIITIKGIDYAIQKIALTSGWITSTYYAYGLKAIHDKTAQSFLIFQGTTVPSDHGFLAGILADTRPVGAIGSQLYARGQKTLRNWISGECIRTKKRVMCTGQSLGAAMSMHAHIHQPAEVDYFVMNPPSLTSREKDIYESRLHQPLPDEVKTVVSHTNDPVWGLGSHYLPPGTTIFRHGKKDENSYLAHAKAPDCSAEASELQSVEHSNRPGTFYFWKIIKPFLFLSVLILVTISLPVRIIIKIAQIIASYSHHQENNNNVWQNDGQFHDDTQGTHLASKFQPESRLQVHHTRPLSFFSSITTRQPALADETNPLINGAGSTVARLPL